MAKVQNEIRIRVIADTRQFRASITRAQLVLASSFFKKLKLRFRLWRISREDAP